MPETTDLTPISITLDAADREAYRAADLAWRLAKVRSINAERKRARMAAKLPPDANAIAALAKERDDRDTEAKGHDDTKKATRDSAIAKAGQSDKASTFTDIGYEATTGKLKCSREPLLQGSPRAAVKTLQMSDAQADAFVASYLRGLQASHDGADLARQVEQYKVDHPGLFNAGMGEPPPVDPAYEKLKADLKVAQDAMKAEMQAQAAVLAEVVKGENLDLYGGYRCNTDGTVELTERP